MSRVIAQRNIGITHTNLSKTKRQVRNVSFLSIEFLPPMIAYTAAVIDMKIHEMSIEDLIHPGGDRTERS